MYYCLQKERCLFDVKQYTLGKQMLRLTNGLTNIRLHFLVVGSDQIILISLLPEKYHDVCCCTKHVGRHLMILLLQHKIHDICMPQGLAQ